MRALPADLSQLAVLNSCQRSAAEYYAPLKDNDDQILKIGAWCVLLEREEVEPAQYPRVIELATYGAVQSRAFRFFETNWKHDLAALAAAKIATSEASAEALAMRAELACDPAAAVEAQRYRFLATGRPDVLRGLAAKVEAASGWRAALGVAAKALALYPHDPLAADLVLASLEAARQPDMLEAVLELLARNGLHAYLVAVYTASLRLARGDAAACIEALRRADAMRPPRVDVALKMHATMLRLKAQALERMGDFRGAYAAFQDLNKIDDGKPIRLEDFGAVLLAAAARDVPPLPPDPHVGHFVMTGFPRSGTTLLENALAAHPLIETFEEIPSSASMDLYLNQAFPTATTTEERVEVYLEGRARYYDEEMRRSRKAGAQVFVDKMPLRSAEAGFISKVFPDKRYIFSIRHPYDVVLSCFKQTFARNIAMEHFRTFEGAAGLYDFTMRQWFGVYGLEDPRVHYLRYDTLVTEFEPSLRQTLAFLGVPWDDAVLDFAEAAERRAARTPSYQKVRQGLTIGVQSQWRDYGFLFESEAAKPLHKWAEFFGYPTK